MILVIKAIIVLFKAAFHWSLRFRVTTTCRQMLALRQWEEAILILNFG